VLSETAGDPLLCERLLLAVTGSPAALAMPQNVLLLRQAFVRELHVIMSRGAQRFLRPYTMRLFAGSWVHTETHRVADGLLVPHLDLTEAIDLMLVMPATANAIGKAAHGICDDLVSTAIVASPAPVVLVPAMNGRMWGSRVVQHNVALARELGYHVVEPAVGFQLADLGESTGMMPPLEQILTELIDIVAAARTPVPADA
jgi:phosphopantothenoylcysteine decarboxylase/phosphopantothenate--cysteine ligase